MRQLSRLARAVARYAYLLLLSMLVVGAAAYVSALRTPTTYQATALLAIEPGSYTTDAQLNLGAVSYVVTLAQTYAGAPLPQDVLSAAHLAVPERSPAQLQAEVRLAAVPAQPQLSVVAQDSDDETAQDVANSVALALVSHYTLQAAAAVQQNPKVITLQQQLSVISAQLGATRAAIASARARKLSTTALQTQLLQEQVQADQVATQLAAAQQVALQSQPIFWLSAVARTATIVQAGAIISTSLGVCAGLLVGVVLALLLDALDVTIRSGADVQRWIGLGTLGVLPAAPAAASAASPAITPQQYAPIADPFRRLFTTLTLLNLTRTQQTLLVTLADAKLADNWALADLNGWVAMHLAVTAALAGEPTLLIDANWAVPTVEGLFGLAVQETGVFTSMLDVAAGTAPLPVAVQPTAIPRLSVLPVGLVPPNHEELLNSDLLDRLLHALRKEYRQIVVLGPRPPHSPADARLARLADGTLLVARSGATSGLTMAHTVATLRKSYAYVTGTVLLSDMPAPASASPWPQDLVAWPEQPTTPHVERARPAGPLQSVPDAAPLPNRDRDDPPAIPEGPSHPHDSSV